MSILNYLEAKIVNHCNYNCRACGTFSNLADHSEYGIYEYERDIKKISQLFTKVVDFRLVGGEPLLSNEITDYIIITRKYLPQTDIRLVTNGYLLKDKDAHFFQTLKNHDIKVDISSYRNKDNKSKNKILSGVEKLKQIKVPYYINDIQYFSIMFDTQQNNRNLTEVFNNCRDRMECNNMYHGKIYPCARSFSVQNYDKKYDSSFYYPNVGINILQENLTGKDVLQYLKKPIGLCRYCSDFPSFFEWREGKPSTYDWFKQEESELYRDQIILYEYFKKAKYLTIHAACVHQNHLEFISIKEDDITKEVSETNYIWVDNSNSRMYFDQYLKVILKKNNISDMKLIKNDFIGSDSIEKLIDIEEITVPCKILFITASNKSLLKATKSLSKLLRVYNK